MNDDIPIGIMPPNPDKLIADCYLLLLRLPYSSPVRYAAQNVMARCVDHIANRSGLSHETVQTACERETARYHIENLKQQPFEVSGDGQ